MVTSRKKAPSQVLPHWPDAAAEAAGVMASPLTLAFGVWHQQFQRALCWGPRMHSPPGSLPPPPGGYSLCSLKNNCSRNPPPLLASASRRWRWQWQAPAFHGNTLIFVLLSCLLSKKLNAGMSSVCGQSDREMKAAVLEEVRGAWSLSFCLAAQRQFLSCGEMSPLHEKQSRFPGIRRG